MTAPSLARRPPKVLVTKVGLDGHDRGSRLVATFLRDAGMEVVYTAPWQEIATVVKLALEEDVDVWPPTTSWCPRCWRRCARRAWATSGW
ncbi:MAG: cobalamin B12-binding domain-containing protein [Alphaproteobacteria bacterium]